MCELGEYVQGDSAPIAEVELDAGHADATAARGVETQ